MAAAASPAIASVTIGQLAALNPTNNCSGAQTDFVQLSVTEGTGYQVQGAGTVTSWSTSASSEAGQVYKMKLYRPTSTPNTFQVIGVDGPRALAPGVVNNFATIIEVQPGDLLGLNRAPGSSTCVLVGGGTSGFAFPSDFALNAQATFGFTSPNRLNISAVIEPSNEFTLGGITRNKKKGIAKLAVTVPGPGEVIATGKGVKSSGAGATTRVSATVAGEVILTIKAKGKKRATLLDAGKVKLNANVQYTPTGGDPRTQSRKVTLKKNL